MGMELLYLIGSIASSFLTSSVLSLSLALRSLFSSSSSGGQTGHGDDPPPLHIYEGRVKHIRTRPVYHAFEYPASYALVDLDRCAENPPFPLAGYLSADQAREATGTNGPVLLLTIPRSVGYDQNPLSVYYCFDSEEHVSDGDGGSRGTENRHVKSSGKAELRMCIAEVTNTPWAERVNFAFNPGSDLIAKPLHVSPFMDMLGNWKIRADTPGENLSIVITVQHPTFGNFFTAILNAKRVSCSSSPVKVAIHFWLMPHKVAVWIYWQALKLWWKGVSFIQHPKFVCPTYREDALLRDRKLSCPFKNEESTNSHHQLSSDSSFLDNDNKERWCIWRDAQWPWS